MSSQTEPKVIGTERMGKPLHVLLIIVRNFVTHFCDGLARFPYWQKTCLDDLRLASAIPRTG